MKLYGYARSSASYRVRIALNLKDIPYQYEPVSLARNEHRSQAFTMLNPQQVVPVLEHQGTLVTQSFAIIEYLEELFPECPLYPDSVAGRVRARSFALTIACDMHPLHSQRVLQSLAMATGGQESNPDWAARWVIQGLQALEAGLAADATSGLFCFADTPTIADIFLVPQLNSARRFGINLSQFPVLQAIERNCMQIDAFASAAPEWQPDWSAS